MRYTIDDGLKVVDCLISNGFKNVKLIGSLASKGYSSNDIDILLSDYGATGFIKQSLNYILKPKGAIESTDWGGFYFNDTIFGNVDIFFTTKDFDR